MGKWDSIWIFSSFFLNKTPAKCCGESGLGFPSKAQVEYNTAGAGAWPMGTWVVPSVEIAELSIGSEKASSPFKLSGKTGTNK